jgi:hypothetical protein
MAVGGVDLLVIHSLQVGKMRTTEGSIHLNGVIFSLPLTRGNTFKTTFAQPSPVCLIAQSNQVFTLLAMTS